jgi:hypothetical protein
MKTHIPILRHKPFLLWIFVSTARAESPGFFDASVRNAGEFADKASQAICPWIQAVDMHPRDSFHE